MEDNKYSRSRIDMRAKRRKTNIILNTLIIIVITLIIVVAGKIFFGDSKTEQQEKQKAALQEKNADNQRETKELDGNSNEDDVAGVDEGESDDVQDESEVTEQTSNEENVEKVIVDPSWKPIGTQQTLGHEPSRTKGTVDWNEKEQAAAYAIGAEEIVNWWTERGEDPEKTAVMTVSAKGSDDTYRVYIEWVEGEGWKPTEVKKLIVNDKR